jgi:UDP-GlcNAc:undecaprenyl-phosphate/decaprenyl-phosphate GlcNAc-1-phosphate transferase
MYCSLPFIADAPPPNWDDVLAPHIYVFYAAFIVSFLFTPVMRLVAVNYGIVDAPDSVRKFHKAPVAYLGGVAVFMGWVAGLALSQLHLVPPDAMAPHLRVKLSIVLGATAIIILGLWDDIRHIRPRYKIMGQIAAALILLTQGVGAHSLDPVISPINERVVRLMGPAFQLSPRACLILSSLFVICMVVSCSNATNLLDGLDGLCGGVTAVIAAGFLFLAVTLATKSMHPEQDPVRIVLALALLGAVLGFVPFNFNPASIFMGDTGSMFLGYACATMILLLAEDQSKWLLAALVMFALPILDTSLAFARRWVNGRPLFSADRHHFHHQLLARGLTVRKTVLTSYFLALGFCLLGALIAYMRTRYAVAFYLVIFGSIIVTAYKMGMVHEKSDALNAAESATPAKPASASSSVLADDSKQARPISRPAPSAPSPAAEEAAF